MKRSRVTAVRYMPMDTVLSLPRIRILRALRFFDWVSSADLLIALDVGDHDRPAMLAAIAHVADEGLVERSAGRPPYDYRITADGRAELAAYMKKTLLGDLDEPDRNARRSRARAQGAH